MTTSYDVSRALVAELGGNPGNTAIVKAVAIWLAYESGSTIYGNNPWNMRPTSLPPGVKSCGTDRKNFIKFCNVDDGIKTAAYQLNKDDWRGYRAISNAIRAGNVSAFFYALAKSKWSSDNYGGGGKFFSAFSSGANYNRTLSFKERGGGTSPGGGSVGSSSANAILATAISSFQDVLRKLGISTDPGHIITPEEAAKIADEYANRYNFQKGSSVWNEIKNSFAGKSVADASKDQSIIPDIPGAINALGETIGDVALTFIIVLIGLVFIAGGIFLFRKGGTSE